MLNRLYGWYGKRVVRGVFIAVLVLIIAGVYIGKNKNGDVSGATESEKPVVTLSAVSDLHSASRFSVVGTVRAVSEARLETEAGGRVTSVSVNIGDTVSAGTILATIENSQERAQLLQAQGAYESALASSLQNGTSLEEARVGVQNAYRGTFSTVEDVVRNNIDQFFSNPTGAITGFRINGAPNPLEQIARRREIESMLNAWSENIVKSGNADDVLDHLTDAEKTITSIANYAVTLASFISDPDMNSFTTEERAEYSADLADARASLDGALTTISRARDLYEQAKISAAPGTISQSSAREKSALGVLRAAEATYEKTLIRTPIKGVVNALYLKAGEYTSSGKPAALVANNGSLEIVTALGEDDFGTVHVGDPVLVNGTTNGTVTRVAPAIDPLTGKIEVKIGVEGGATLKNGSTVNVSFSRATESVTDGKIIIPLSALKLLSSGPVAFGVNDALALVSYPVVLGAVVGESVEIVEGLTPSQIIVRDARGLKEGDAVTVAQN